MKREELLSAIGGIDEKYLSESEMFTALPRRHILRRAVLVAAATAILAVTAAATISHFLQIGGHQVSAENKSMTLDTLRIIENDGDIVVVEDYTLRTISRKVCLELATNPDAPEEIQTAWTIKTPESCAPVRCTHPLPDQPISNFALFWDANGDGIIKHCNDTSDDYIAFIQTSAHSYNAGINGENVIDSLDGIPERVEIPTEVLQLGGIDVLKITIPPFTLTFEESPQITMRQQYMEGGEQRLYWSDGDSIFTLICPSWMTSEEMAKILETLHTVDDIRSHLDSFAP